MSVRCQFRFFVLISFCRLIQTVLWLRIWILLSSLRSWSIQRNSPIGTKWTSESQNKRLWQVELAAAGSEEWGAEQKCSGRFCLIDLTRRHSCNCAASGSVGPGFVEGLRGQGEGFSETPKAPGGGGRHAGVQHFTYPRLTPPHTQRGGKISCRRPGRWLVDTITAPHLAPKNRPPACFEGPPYTHAACAIPTTENHLTLQFLTFL